MADARVTSFGKDGRIAREIQIRLGRHDANFDLNFDKLDKYFLDAANNREVDFLNIASTVFAADCQVRRGGPTREGFGAAWRRKLKFAVPVRDLPFWQDPAVAAALTETVEFLTEDQISFEFSKHPDPRLIQPNMFAASSGDNDAACVVLFSGGLDSLAGAIELLSTTDKRLLLVTHFSATKRLKYAETLAMQLAHRFPKRVKWVPVTARLKGVQASEATQRSRSLLFVAIGLVAAGYSRARDIRFFENGIVSSNLPISAQVIGTMASRTTHPKCVALLDQLLSKISGGRANLANPFFWKTKAEVVEALVHCGGADLIKYSVSCSHVIQQTTMRPHCGACSQCLDRRFGVLAAGEGDSEEGFSYEPDVLVGTRTKKLSRTMALDWTRHALAIASMSDDEFLSKFGAEFSQIAEGIDDRSPPEVRRDLIALHRRHGQYVRRVIREAIGQHSAEITDGTLPSTSLLRMIVGERNRIGDDVAPTLVAVPLSQDEPATDASEFPFVVVVSGRGKSALVEVAGLGAVRGANAAVIPVLLAHRVEQLAGGLDFVNHKGLATGEIAKELEISKAGVRQSVSRLTRELAEYYQAVNGEPPAEPLLVERHHSGYRLRPEWDVREG